MKPLWQGRIQDKQNAPSHILKDYLWPIGGYLLGIGGLIANKLPLWAIITGGIYLVFVIAWRVVPVGWLWLRKKIADRQSANYFYPYIGQCIKNFNDIITSNNTSTLLSYIANDIKCSNCFRLNPEDAIPLNLEYLSTIRNYLSFISMQNSKKNNSENFSQNSRELFMLIGRYNQMLVSVQSHIVKLVREGKITGDSLINLKTEWNTRLRKYVQFVDEAEKLASDINEHFSGACQKYFEQVKTIE